MPEICYFYGIHIYLYFNDHSPPHFHAIYGEHEVRVAIADGRKLTGSLPRRAQRLVDKWLTAHRDDLMAAWKKAQERTDPGRIDPLP